jgi:hypothetical protein
MAIQVKTVEERLRNVIAAWEALRPAKSFAGMTLNQFKTKVQPSFDARDQVVECANKRAAALTARAEADEVSNKLALAVVDAVKGDIEEGADGELYAAMGYVRKSARKSGLKRTVKKAA